MEKYTLAGVGVATGFTQSETPNLLFNATTLQDSSVQISVTAEEIRGGLGNPLLAQYFHDALMQATLTDALFNMEYFALNCGGTVTIGGESVVQEEVIVTQANMITVTGTPVGFGDFGTVVGWYTIQGEDDWKTIKFSGQTAETTNLPENTVICVKYNTSNDTMRKFSVSGSIIPAEIHLVLTFPLFSAGAKKFTDSYKVGELIVDIPRFQLDGAYELSMTATGAATNPLSGKALVSYLDKSCEDMGRFATIGEVIHGKNWYDGLTAIAVEGADVQLAVGETNMLKIIGLYGATLTTRPIDNTRFTFTTDSDAIATVSPDGIITAVATGETGVKIIVTDTATSNDPVEGYASVTVTA